jgi:4-hydroxy-tetrahydrodipicolinate synthase
MDATYAIDETALADHVRSVTAHDGIVGVLANGHAGENYFLSRAEKRQVLEITRGVIQGDRLVVAGINAENSLDAAKEARDAELAGADIVMVFPPNSWALSQDQHMACNHHRYIAEATDLPLMLFQGSVKAGRIAYTQEVLEALVSLPNVVGIKEGSWETSAYEANRRIIKEVAPHVAVMASGDEHLLSTFILGSDGSLVSLAIVIPETIVALDLAVKAGDLVAARRCHETIYPLAKAIYGTPGGHVPARLKACLRLLGRLQVDHVRPPMERVRAEEEEILRTALARAGLT